MKKYMGFSRAAGANEVAVLIFSDSIKQAKKLLWDSAPEFISDYTDIGLKHLGEGYEHLDAEKKSGKPHIIDNPVSCNMCLQWGGMLEDGICQNCKGM